MSGMSYLIDEGDLAELAHGNAAERERDWIKIWVQPIHKPSFFFFFSHYSDSHAKSERDTC